MLFNWIQRGTQKSALWDNEHPIREELFSRERFEHHAETLASANISTFINNRSTDLRERLNDNVAQLLSAYRSISTAVSEGHAVTPAAEWILNNSHLVHELVSDIRRNLPEAYDKVLPKLEQGPFAGYARVYSIAWAFVAHSDSRFDEPLFKAFVMAYQRIAPLTISEVWALPIAIRLVLVENLRRSACRIVSSRAARTEADLLVETLFVTQSGIKQNTLTCPPLREFDDGGSLRQDYVVRLLQRLRDTGEEGHQVLATLERSLESAGASKDEIVRREMLVIGATNVTVRHIMRSMRMLTDIDWAKFFEDVSFVEAVLRRHPGYAAMDFPTRNAYRNAIESLARRCSSSEVEIAADAVNRASSAAVGSKASDPGFYLLSKGRSELEASIAVKSGLRDLLKATATKGGLPAYMAVIGTTAAGVLGVPLLLLSGQDVSSSAILLMAAIGILPAIELATAITNLAVTHEIKPEFLPALELKSGVPVAGRTLIVIPTLISSLSAADEMLERVETHYLATQQDNAYFAVLSDWIDSDVASNPHDLDILAHIRRGIGSLNAIYHASSDPMFFVLHRRRLWNFGEGKWMGWERKRGKLAELNRLLRGDTETTFLADDSGQVKYPPDIRYVITLDSDTRLPRDAALRLIGKMLHPLNRPELSASGRRVVDGHALLQPRISPSLPTKQAATLFQFLFSTAGGIDPYAGAISDVYQDLFGEGSFTGKGIYEIDAFEHVLSGRLPENAILSHDLLEGIYLRAGLATDIELIEEYPARYDIARSRDHRWTRGDWQLLPWIFASRSAGIAALGVWKLVDNLRRSLTPISVVAALTAGWLLPAPAAAIWTAFIAIALVIPTLFSVIMRLARKSEDVTDESHMAALAADTRLALAQTAVNAVLLADRAALVLDATARSLYRVYVSRSNLLEWTTAAQATSFAARTRLGYAHRMTGGIIVALLVALIVGWFGTDTRSEMYLALPFVALWSASPIIAHWMSFKTVGIQVETLSLDSRHALRAIGRSTWSFFEEFVTKKDNDLPPDNFQEDPLPIVAHRTSPTNIGLYLLSAASARQMGWISTSEAAARLEDTLRTMSRLERFRGHYYNWYDTLNCSVLPPRYISTVDSGNLAGHLIAVANMARAWSIIPATPQSVAILGMRDALELFPVERLATNPELRTMVVELQRTLFRANESAPVDWAQVSKAALKIENFCTSSSSSELRTVRAAKAARCTAGSHAREGRMDDAAVERLKLRLLVIARQADFLVNRMDFSFLLDEERQLLSIGYSTDTSKLDESCYDLLASEARLASFVAIAKGDIPLRHWFKLGRPPLARHGKSVLTSWSGSMFEYMMPELVVMTPNDSLLGSTKRVCLDEHIRFGTRRGIPWGVSESAYNARDLNFAYQYSGFGLSELGLKRGLDESLVIAPYATALASMVMPAAAAANYKALEAIGGRGAFGFYEAVDYTPSRVPEGAKYVVIMAYMAHHQGMTVAAIANAVLDNVLVRAFHDSPLVTASELLLHERAPRFVPKDTPRATLINTRARDEESVVSHVRRIDATLGSSPDCNVLGNRRLSSLVTAAGTGYVTWKDMAITRWHGDRTLDDLGSFLYVRDRRSGLSWSIGRQPMNTPATSYETLFSEGRVQINRVDGSLRQTLEFVVSSEDDVLCRRLTLVNAGTVSRVVDVTSYDELVLAARSADAAHPAFTKLFVETAHDQELGAVVAAKRPRSPQDEKVFVAAFIAGDNGETFDEFETDRARFIGRNRTLRSPRAIVSGISLSNTVGAVIDPVIALRRKVTLAPGEKVRLCFWTVIVGSREEAAPLIEKYKERTAFSRLSILTWTHGLVTLRHLGIEAEEALLFQELAGAIAYGDPTLRAPEKAVQSSATGYRDVWAASVSGDLPICLVFIDDIVDIGVVRQLFHAFEYWRSKAIEIDLVVVNTHEASYQQDLQTALEALYQMVEAQHRLPTDNTKGRVFLLRSDLVQPRTIQALTSAARAVFRARRGLLAEQLAAARKERIAPPSVSRNPPSAYTDNSSLAPLTLEFDNGIGGFAEYGSEYVVKMSGGATTPAPWINVIANPTFGCHLAADGIGYTWALNARERQITPWSNDAVTNRPGDIIYIRDDETGELWTPTAAPIRRIEAHYRARHGQGYTSYESRIAGVSVEMRITVSPTDPVRFTEIVLENLTECVRRISVTSYVEWLLGGHGRTSAFETHTWFESLSSTIFARNPWSQFFPDRVAFSRIAGSLSGWTADRTEFIGREQNVSAPAGLQSGKLLSAKAGAVLEPCAVLQTALILAPGEKRTLQLMLGDAADHQSAQDLITKYDQVTATDVLEDAKAAWNERLGRIEIKTPDRALDILVNRWLPYQALSCRVWGRAGFYQAGGAFGFRDQLQDSLAFAVIEPSIPRAQILRSAGRQFVEGDVQHWWLEPSGHGIRTRIADACLWLPYGVAHYVRTTGDKGLLDEVVAFLEAPMLQPHEHEVYILPTTSPDQGTIFEHCARAIDRSLAVGPKGMTLIGAGDWNDGMNRVGAAGKGESVWMSWFLIRCIADFLPIADARGESERSDKWRSHADDLRKSIDNEAWDGAWYRRATFDDGTWIGSQDSAECSIDAIAQSWSVISGGGDPDRSLQAMHSVLTRLVDTQDRLQLLFTPPFDKTPLDPGYIKAYPPGVRENGGQYTHAAAWNIIAFAELGDGDAAAKLLSIVNPINATLSRRDAKQYRLEPYVIAADVYSQGANRRRGGWSWYTGSAAWVYRAAIEHLLGVRREGNALVVQPAIPSTWPGYEVKITLDGSIYSVIVTNRGGADRLVRAELDGTEIEIIEGRSVRVQIDPSCQHHRLLIELAEARSIPSGLHLEEHV